MEDDATNLQTETEPVTDDVTVDEELLAAQPEGLGIKDGTSNS